MAQVFCFGSRWQVYCSYMQRAWCRWIRNGMYDRSNKDSVPEIGRFVPDATRRILLCWNHLRPPWHQSSRLICEACYSQDPKHTQTHVETEGCWRWEIQLIDKIENTSSSNLSSRIWSALNFARQISVFVSIAAASFKSLFLHRQTKIGVRPSDKPFFFRFWQNGRNSQRI